MKKLLLVLSIVLFLIVLAAALIPFLFKDKIFTMVKETANKELNAIVNFNNDISLSIFSHFPDLTLTVKDISVSGINEFEGDTLAAIPAFSATIDLMSILKGEKIQVERIYLESPRIKAIVLANGKANWDIAKASDDSTSSENPDTATTAFQIGLKELTITNAYIFYDDKQGNMMAKLSGFNHSLKGDFTESLFTMHTDNACKELTVAYGGIQYLSKVNMTLVADLDAEMDAMKFTFRNNEATLNGLHLAMEGWYAMPGDDMKMDIKFEAKKAAFKDFLSLVPALYAKDFNSIESSGNLAFNGNVTGTYNDKTIPAFNFNLIVENGQFKYPALPVPVKDVQVKLLVSNPDGDLNHTKINLSTFHFTVSNDPFDAKLIASDLMTDPLMDAMFKGRINLDNITKIIPLEKGTTLSGQLAIDLSANGRVSTIEKEQYESFRATGNLNIDKFVYESNELKTPFHIDAANVTFTPVKVALTKFDAHIGKSDFKMNGELTNFFAYTFGKGTIQGLLNITANKIDANEFLSDQPENASATNTVDTTSIDAPEIPSNINFKMNCSIGELLYTNMVITNFKGSLGIANQKLSFSNVALNTLGSAMQMDGYYETTNPKKPTVAMDYAVRNLDIQKAFITFNTVKKLAPIAEKTNGSFSTSMKMNTTLDAHLNPIYDNLFAEGTLNIPHANMKGVKLFDKAAEVLKYDRLKDPALNNVNIRFKIEKGRIFTQPFDVTVASQKLTLSGSSGLDQTLDYTGKVNIPRSAFGKGSDAADKLMAQANAKAGTGVKLSENIPVNLFIKGTFTSPDITTNASDIAKNEANLIKDQLAAEAEKKRKELEAKAKLEADRLKKEGEQKLKAETDRLKKEADEKAKAEKEKSKKKLEEEAKKQLKGIFGK